MTSDEEWDPRALDYDPVLQDEDWVDTLRQHAVDSPHIHKFCDEGDYRDIHLPRVGRYQRDDEVEARVHFFDACYAPHPTPLIIQEHFFDAIDDDGDESVVSTADDYRDLDDLMDDCIAYLHAIQPHELDWERHH